MSSDEKVDHAFEAKNGWRLQNLNWCKCCHCTLKPKAIELFCGHEKVLEYDEYDGLLNKAETQGDKCLTARADFKANMLSERVLKIDVSCYLEDNWPLDDDDLEKIHKLYRLVSYQRCARWIFQVLGKKIEDRSLHVFTQRFENSLPHMMEFILILNTPKSRNSKRR